MSDTTQFFFNEIIDAITQAIGEETFQVTQPLQVRLSPIEDDLADPVAEIINAILAG
ncbi:hypothetical protein KJ611_00450 [Patescibacteria group bacterium]|nr:hypothetical protein [Patescibacteria group bacterium]MBU1705762.1 hypothetical protein [Patescibacteria group bacterium]